jgi:mono/diheme cytochrome c family protein
MKRAGWTGSGWMVVSVTLVILSMTGCQKTEPPLFRLNFEGRPRDSLSWEQQQALVDALDGLFGQPDRPYVHENSELDFGLVVQASGPTGRTRDVLLTEDQKVYVGQKDAEKSTQDEIVIDDIDAGEVKLAADQVVEEFTQEGLYRQHCVHCHGVTGDGLGPTAGFLNPYPRDFRRGIFKYVSTDPQSGTSKPSRHDIRSVLERGIPGTSMPSFALLPPEQLDALTEYVRYLSMRGEVETLVREVYVIPGDELTWDDVTDYELPDAAERWADAADGDSALEIPERPEGLTHEESVALGKDLFLNNKTAQCANCHGAYALGDGLPEPHYDEWNKPKLQDPDDYSLPIQSLKPRNLRTPLYRGGQSPADLYRRIALGIPGSGMPAFGQSLTPEQIWALVDYVRTLPYEGHAPTGDASESTLAARPRN